MSEDYDAVPIIGKEQIDVLLAFLPIFEQEGFHAGRWITEKGYFPYFLSSPEVDRFQHALYDQNIVFSFDWSAWEEKKYYAENNDALADADLLTLRKLLTAHIRSDRFVEGHFGAVVESGHIAAILRRLQQLRAQMSS